jgi:hypothetical protein
MTICPNHIFTVKETQENVSKNIIIMGVDINLYILDAVMWT